MRVAASPSAPAGAAATVTPASIPAPAASTAGAASPPTAAGPGAAGPRVTVVPGIARYHKPDCILIRFLGEEDLQIMHLGEAEESGCVPCRACRPEKELASA